MMKRFKSFAFLQSNSSHKFRQFYHSNSRIGQATQLPNHYILLWKLLPKFFLISTFTLSSIFTLNVFQTFSKSSFPSSEELNNLDSLDSNEKLKILKNYIRDRMESNSEPNQLFTDVYSNKYILAESNTIMDESSDDVVIEDGNYNKTFEKDPRIYRIVLTGGMYNLFNIQYSQSSLHSLVS